MLVVCGPLADPLCMNVVCQGQGALGASVQIKEDWVDFKCNPVLGEGPLGKGPRL